MLIRITYKVYLHMFRMKCTFKNAITICQFLEQLDMLICNLNVKKQNTFRKIIQYVNFDKTLSFTRFKYQCILCNTYILIYTFSKFSKNIENSEWSYLWILIRLVTKKQVPQMRSTTQNLKKNLYESIT